jgi:hypothetical protein
MSEDDVYPGEMDAPHEFDDQAAEALLSGSDRGTDPHVAELLDDMRVAYTSQPPAVGAELAAVLAEAEVTADASPARRLERMRSSIVAKAGAAAAAVFAATGGLAVAHALPASMQDAASDIGIGAPAHRVHTAVAVHVTPDDSTTIEPTSTTVPDDEHNAVEQGDDNDHGAVVGHNEGDNDQQGENECEAEQQGEREGADDAVTPTTVCTPTTETTVAGSHDGNVSDDHETENENEHPTVTTVPEANDDNRGPSVSAGRGSGGDDGATTPTTASNSGPGAGDDSNSGRAGGGSSNDG